MQPAGEMALVYGGIALVVGLVSHAPAGPWDDVLHLALVVVFVGVALRLAQREPGGPRRYGIDLAGLLEPVDDRAEAGPLGLWDLARTLRRALPRAAKEIGIALGVAAVVFPLYALGFAEWHGPEHPFALQFPPAPVAALTTQLVLVAWPEETLFRGYFQTRLTDLWPTARRVLGVSVSGRALLAQAALFAVLHVVAQPHVARLAVFFPGLLFGWLRAWRGGIGSAVILHALSNLYSETLVRSWLASVHEGV